MLMFDSKADLSPGGQVYAGISWLDFPYQGGFFHSVSEGDLELVDNNRKTNRKTNKGHQIRVDC